MDGLRLVLGQQRSVGLGLVRPTQLNEKGLIMLSWTLAFLIIALLAAFLGFSGIAGVAAGIAKILFVLFLILFVLSLIFSGRRPT
jgi:uncharacterized membrane protein YtjA (UPF0391 family)